MSPADNQKPQKNTSSTPQVDLFSNNVEPDTETEKKSEKRKFRVAGGYYFDFAQFSRLMNVILDHRDDSRISRTTLEDETGFPDRHLENLVSMGSAMGLVRGGSQKHTPIGFLIAAHDMFFQKTGTLQWCHYVGAGSYRNLIWFDIFNRFLPEKGAGSVEEWTIQFRKELAGKYTRRTIAQCLFEEVRAIADAYTNQAFKSLGLLEADAEGRLYRRRPAVLDPTVFCAMLYDYGEKTGGRVLETAALLGTPGSPAAVFGLDGETLRGIIGKCHERGFLRYETAHNLDQARLLPGYGAPEFLAAYLEERKPRRTEENS